MHIARQDERGFTLIEVLVAVVILGIAFAVIVGGMGASIMASDIQRKQSTTETLLRSFAEDVKAASFVPTASTTSYSAPSKPAYTASIVSVECLAPGSTTAVQACTDSSTLQRIVLQVQSNDGRDVQSMTVIKRKP